MGIIQHHDAVSGTSKQDVADDYARRLAVGVAACQEVINSAAAVVLPKSPHLAPLVINFCHLLNVSYCNYTEDSRQFVAIVYNSLAHDTYYHVRIPVSGINYVVLNSQLRIVKFQMVPISGTTMKVPDYVGSRATSEIVFEATLPALGFNSYIVAEATHASSEIRSESSASIPDVEDIVIKNEHLSVTFSGTTGLMKSLMNLDKSISLPVSQSLMYYKSYNLPNEQPSNAYVFRPNGTDAIPLTTRVTLSLIQGNTVQEVRQTFNDWTSQIVRLYSGAHHLEIEWTVGPIPTVVDNIGKEVISRYVTPLRTNATFYTDANGREILKRVRDYRPTWKLTQTEPISGNYYPVNSRIFIQDIEKNVQLTVLTDRSQGGSSVHDGEIELMLHRRIVAKDGFGEALNETGIDGKGLVVWGKQYVYLDDIAGSVVQHRKMAQRLYMAPIIGFIITNTTAVQYANNYITTWSGLNTRLPDNIHLLTFEQWHSRLHLIRLEHFYETNEDQQMSQPATVSLKSLFAPFTVESAVEYTLGANQQLDAATRLQWSIQDYGTTKRDMSSYVTPVDPTSMNVELKPMQIRTFHIKLSAAKFH